MCVLPRRFARYAARKTLEGEQTKAEAKCKSKVQKKTQKVLVRFGPSAFVGLGPRAPGSGPWLRVVAPLL